MHRLADRTYVGQPNENASLTTKVDGGGQISITLDGQPFAGSPFSLSASAGDRRNLQIALLGPTGASCVVGIAVVDGGTDGDLLLCQPHDPAPVQFYTFAVAPPNAVAHLAKLKGVSLVPIGAGQKGRKR